MKATKVLFINTEILPYMSDSKQSVIGRQLAQRIQENGHEIRTFMPRFGLINERRNQLHEVIRLSGMNLIINDTDHPLIIKVSSIQPARMQVYFIDNDDYFTRRATYADENGVGRSDSIMIATIDTIHKKLKLTSIMRDSYVDIEGYGYDKINHVNRIK